MDRHHSPMPISCLGSTAYLSSLPSYPWVLVLIIENSGLKLLDCFLSLKHGKLSGRYRDGKPLCLLFLIFIISIPIHDTQPPYLVTINRCVCDVLKNHLQQSVLTPTSQLPSFFDFCAKYAMNSASHVDFILAIFHATWLHASVGQFAQLYRLVAD